MSPSSPHWSSIYVPPEANVTARCPQRLLAYKVIASAPPSRSTHTEARRHPHLDELSASHHGLQTSTNERCYCAGSGRVYWPLVLPHSGPRLSATRWGPFLCAAAGVL